jgi:hypothetical protein
MVRGSSQEKKGKAGVGEGGLTYLRKIRFIYNDVDFA